MRNDLIKTLPGAAEGFSISSQRISFFACTTPALIPTYLHSHFPCIMSLKFSYNALYAL